ncbi:MULTISPECIES: hypothetical protein [Kitasatospora]|uniref:Uncharacterized protein n=1 Tax=Kitasatospora setae (strain ATCC 33774 / DSM 43861 / JCM 3304 / KCC A-0304 / NBRC 14216 / KM-6054) TaxID=452652 RepID=E4N4S5_KITSK|nr:MULTISPECIES: hypothetical protein [Kitasatospora]BAJ26206.1 hypothetical protein KSE_03590 [Kitasatospora setae KM-6054]
MRKAISALGLTGLLTAAALLAAPTAQASGFVYVGMYPSGAACEAAGKAYVARGETVNYFCDVAPNTARLSIWA